MPPKGDLPEKAPWSLIIAIIIIFIAIIAAGVLFYQSQEEQIKSSVATDLSSIAMLKADQIAVWRGERLADVIVLSQNRFFSDGVKEYLSSPDSAKREKILTLFGKINTSYKYHNVQLFDSNGRVQLSLEPLDIAMSPVLETELARSMATQETVLTDITHGTDSTTPQMYAIAPLLVTDNEKTVVVGATVLTIDPARDLYPFIQSWPVPSRTSETLLIEREGNHVLFLNELRHQKNTALNLTIPLSETHVPAVMAVLGTTGVFSGKDYRGVDVISVLRPIPNSPWFMVTKVDMDEAYSAWQSRSILIIVLVTGTLVVALIIVGLVWQRRQKSYYRALYSAEVERGRAEERNRERLETLVRLADMGSAGEQELVDFVLNAECRLMESPLAFIGVMMRDETIFDITAWSKAAMTDPFVAVSPVRFPVEKAGIWAEAVRKRESFVENNYSATSREKNDFMHVPVARFASVPIFERGRIVMVCAVANKQTDYTLSDIDNLTLLMQGVWTHLQKRAADETIRLKTTDLEAAYEEITASDEERRANYAEIARTQRALEVSERKYRNLYQYAQVGLFETCLKDATVVACNEQYATLAGFSSIEDAIGKDILHLYANAGDRDEVSRILREYGAIENHIVMLRNQSTGKHFWAQFSARYNYDRDIAEGSIIDINARKVAEDALRESEKRLRDAQEMAHLGFWFWDIKTGFVEWSEELFRIFWLDPKEFTPQIDSILALSPWPEDHQRDRELIRRAMESHETGTYEQRFFRPDKSVGYYHSTFQGRYDDGGNLTHIVGTVLDITERKLAEDALKASEEKFSKAFKTSPYAITITRVKDGSFIEVNDAFTPITGFTYEDAIAGSSVGLDLWVDPEDRKKVLVALLDDRTVNGVEFLFRKKNNEIITGLFSAQVLSLKNELCVLSSISDISDRKRAVDALRESEEQYRRVVETANEGIIFLDRDARITFANPQIASMLGYPAEEMIGQEFASFLVKDQLPDHSVQMKNRALGKDAVYERSLERKDGQKRWMLISARAIRDSQGTFEGSFGMLTDITDRKAAEESLRHTSERLSLALLAGGIGIWELDLVTNGLIWDDPMFQLYGVTRGTFSSTFEAWRAAVHPDDRAQVETELRMAIQGKKEFDNEFRVVWPDGTIHFHHASALVHLDASGKPVSMVGTNYDITGQKQGEEKIRKNEERLLMAQEIGHVGSWEYNLQTGTLWVSSEWARIYGISQVAGDYSLAQAEACIPERDRVHQALLDLINTGKEFNLEYGLNPADKSYQRAIVSIARLQKDEQGNPVRVVGLIQDITDRKVLEYQRESLIRELERKNAELERFTYTVSHDLKSPLITIKGFAGLLEDDAQKEDPIQLKNDIRRITDAADTMQALLVDLLELSRLGKIVNPPEKIPFGTIAHEAVDLLAGPLAERNVSVVIEPGLTDVYVDRSRIREVMVNLIENAIKFFGHQPHPEIRIGMVRNKGAAVFFVQDNGIGINPLYLERIFNLFERLDASTLGTGIGLTIVRRIIEVHGGKCWAESEGPGKGTTFRFTLPGISPEGEPDAGH
ncbi:MAG: PAS domain S-box protein [Methanoregula sp.]|nr:PAS domain S-box protein [Methanoregula sp.]